MHSTSLAAVASSSRQENVSNHAHEGLAILFCREASVIHFGVLVPSSMAPFCLFIFLDTKLENTLKRVHALGLYVMLIMYPTAVDISGDVSVVFVYKLTM